MSEFTENREGLGKLWSESEENFRKMCEHSSYGPILTASTKVLKSAMVSGCWTAFECAVADCWVAVLNQSPVPLAQHAMSSLSNQSDISEISSKQIPVGLAARYNFDLRSCLGTILRPKFDFTSVSGMKNAFNAAFKGDKKMEELQDILSNPVLRELEVSRNLIVHRAGVIDEEYNRQLSKDLPIGQPLDLPTSKVSEFAEQSSLAAAAVLILVDEWLNSRIQG